MWSVERLSRKKNPLSITFSTLHHTDIGMAVSMPGFNRSIDDAHPVKGKWSF